MASYSYFLAHHVFNTFEILLIQAASPVNWNFSLKKFRQFSTNSIWTTLQNTQHIWQHCAQHVWSEHHSKRTKLENYVCCVPSTGSIINVNVEQVHDVILERRISQHNHREKYILKHLETAEQRNSLHLSMFGTICLLITTCICRNILCMRASDTETQNFALEHNFW